jgi:hypothetical protein
VDILGSEPFTLAKHAVQASRFCQETILYVIPFIDMTFDQLQFFRFRITPTEREHRKRYYQGSRGITRLLAGFLNAFKRFVLPKEYGKAFRECTPALRHRLDTTVRRVDFSPLFPDYEEEGILQLAVLDLLDHCLQEDLDGDDTPSIRFIASHAQFPWYEQVMIRMIKSLHLRDEKTSKAASVSHPTSSAITAASPPSATETSQAAPPSPAPSRSGKRSRTLADSDLLFSLMETVDSYGESLLSTYPRIGAIIGQSAVISMEISLSTRSLQSLFVIFSGLAACEMDGVRPIAAAIQEALADEIHLGIASRGADLWYPNALRLLDLFCRGESLILSPHLP